MAVMLIAGIRFSHPQYETGEASDWRVPRASLVVLGLGRLLKLSSGGSLGAGEDRGEASVFLVFALALQGDLAVEDQLGDVGHGDGLAAVDSVEGHLFEQAAEEDVDIFRDLEIAYASEKAASSGETLRAIANSLIPNP